VPAQTDATGAPLHDAAGRPQLDGGRAIPTLLARVLPAKVRGLGLAALLAALLCGLAASLSALGTTFVNDLYEPRSDAALEKKQDAIQAEMKKLALCRWTTGGAAALVAALACAWSLAPAVRTQNVFPLLLILLAVAGVPSLVAMLLGLFTRTKPQPKNAEA
jgi:Na+/proline symporter